MTVEEVLRKLETNQYGTHLVNRRDRREKTNKDDRDISIVNAYRSGKPTKQIAYDLDVSSVTVYSTLRRHGVPLRRGK
jgi:DNA-binding NarL/FixJ family response regulator